MARQNTAEMDSLEEAQRVFAVGKAEACHGLSQKKVCLFCPEHCTLHGVKRGLNDNNVGDLH